MKGNISKFFSEIMLFVKEKIVKFFLKVMLSIKEKASRISFSIGLGGIISLYIIEYCRINLLPNLQGVEGIYNFIKEKNITSINGIEGGILILSIMAIISAPLLTKRNSKKRLEISLIVILLFVEIVSLMSIVVNTEITILFLLSTTISSIYFVWFIIDILKAIYFWTKVDKLAENQVDVAKLTFIWAVIVFVLGLLR